MTQSALVTGGAGFIGGHLVERLLASGWRVRVLDNLSTGTEANLPVAHPGLELVVGDVCEGDLVRQACAGVERVFHLAAMASVTASVGDPATTHSVNAGGTLNVLCGSLEQGVRRVVFSSSASVYGNPDIVPTDEEQALQPQSPYASQKAIGEYYCRNFAELYGLETAILRYFNVYGPRQSPMSGYAAAIPAFVQAAATGGTPVVYGDGRQTRDFVYVGDVVDANLLAATAPGVVGRACNIAGGTGISILDLLAEIESVAGVPLNPRLEPARAGEVRHSVASIERARSLLGYRPRTPLRTGLRRTLTGGAAPAPARERLAA